MIKLDTWTSIFRAAVTIFPSSADPDADEKLQARPERGIKSCWGLFCACVGTEDSEATKDVSVFATLGACAGGDEFESVREEARHEMQGCWRSEVDLCDVGGDVL